MKSFNILIITISLLLSLVSATSNFQPIAKSAIYNIDEENDLDREFSIQNSYDSILEMTKHHLSKRDGESTILNLLNTVNESGILIKVLHEIAESDKQMDNIANATIKLLEGDTSVLSGLNISLDLNTTQILDAVKKAGLINSTLDELVLNPENRNYLADSLGLVLKRNTWIAKLLSDLGNGHELSIGWIADLVKNTKSKASNMHQVDTQESKQVIISTRDDDDDDDYSGSATQFLSNLINTVTSSNLVHNSLSQVLNAVNESQIVSSIVLQVINDTEIKSMAEHIIGKVYDSGVLNGIDLNSYYNEYKENNVLSNAVQIGLTDPTYAPGLARIFQRMENNGVYQQIQWNLYGGPKK